MAKKFLLYIHEDEKFSREKNKSELINQLLEKYYSSRVEEASLAEVAKALDEAPVPTEGRYAIDHEGNIHGPSTFEPKAPDPETGYPCCTKATPCKHWTWNGNMNYWINGLTGKIKEV